MSERTRLQTQIAEMGFLTRVAGVSLKDRVRSSLLLLCVKRRQFRGFGHLKKMPPGHLPREREEEAMGRTKG